MTPPVCEEYCDFIIEVVRNERRRSKSYELAQVIEESYLPPGHSASLYEYYEWRQILVKLAMGRMVEVIAFWLYLSKSCCMLT
jgi:hypothetical protein